MEVGVPSPLDTENETLVDVEKTFKIDAVAALLFGLAGRFLVLRTRLG